MRVAQTACAIAGVRRRRCGCQFRGHDGPNASINIAKITYPWPGDENMVSNDGHLYPARGSTLDSAAASRKTSWLGFVGLRAATEFSSSFQVLLLLSHISKSACGIITGMCHLGFRVAWLAPSHAASPLWCNLPTSIRASG